MTLRDYQTEICDRVLGALHRHRSVMVQMPTGTGKTLVLAHLVMVALREGAAGHRVLLVTHRRELVEQIVDTIAGMPFSAEEREAICVRSIQALTRGADLGAWVPQLVIVDEAHHALARTYRLLWDRWPEARFLGLTATPCRLSGEGFTDLFEVLVQSWSVRRFMAEGWLVGYDYYSIKPDSEDQWVVDSLQKRGADGDFQLKEMRMKLDAAPLIERLFATFSRYAGARKGLVYAVDIEHAEHIAAFYRERGVAAEAVCAKTPKGLRRRRLEELRGGKLQVLVNVDLFAEGFDCPDVEFIQLARPTLSLSRYLQMVGRGLRPSAGKVCCVILDNVGLYRAFGLPSAERNWQAWFEGWPRRMAKGQAVGPDWGYCGLFPGDLCERTEGSVVKIVSHRWMQQPYREPAQRAFLPMGAGRVNVGGIDLASKDGRIFFPLCALGVLKEDEGIHRKAIETMVGAGLCWKGFFIPYDRPDELFVLEEQGADWHRVYRDAEGRRWWQRDPEAALVPLEEADAASASSEVSSVCASSSEVSASEGAELFCRGFVQLRREGDWVYILNVAHEAGVAHRSWEVRADDRICTVGNRLYFADEPNARPYRIKRRSEDFRLFLLETDCFDLGRDMVLYDMRVLNECDCPLQKVMVPVKSPA